MLTMHNKPECVEIATLYENEQDKKGTPIYWYPKKDPLLKLGVDDVESYLKSPEFRDEYRLSKAAAAAISTALIKGEDVPEEKGLNNKFFEIKKDLENKLYTEMDLGNSKQFLRVDFPRDNHSWTGLHITIGSSGSGKTHHTVDLIMKNLTGPKRWRRRFLYASNELWKDKTLKKLLSDRFHQYVVGVDLSDDAFEESPETSVESWFHNEILPKFKRMGDGSHIVFDDAVDSIAGNYLRKWQNSAYRTLRHKNVGLTSLQHSMRNGRWSSQAYSSVKYVHTFPRGSGKGKLVDYLSKDIGVRLKKAREYVQRFAENGRVMTIRMHNPSCLIGPKGLVLL